MAIQEVTFPVGTRVLLWRLDEEVPQLLALCREAGITVEDIKALPAKRQRENVAERLLLYQALGRPVTLSHTDDGAPCVVGQDVNISITHTQRLVALAVNDRQVIGLDAEQANRQQVIRVRDKFLNASEQLFIAPEDLTSHVIAWTAKEAIIKAERNSAIDWTEGIIVEPFAVNADETVLKAHCGGRNYRLLCRLIEGHFLTLATVGPL